MGVKMAINLDIIYVYNKNVLFVMILSISIRVDNVLRRNTKQKNWKKKMNIPLGF